MGANIMMRYAGLSTEEMQPMKAMVSVNNPFDVWLAINLMRGNIFEKYLTKELRNSMF
jgi:predicted alpha/beta-fold hydrolase